MEQRKLSPKEQIKKGRISLSREAPFFGYLVQYLSPVESKSIPTAAISEDAKLFYNPDFVDSMTEEELEGLLAHEVMHKAMHLFERQGYRDMELVNQAHDLIINFMLYHQNNFKLPNDIDNFMHMYESEDDDKGYDEIRKEIEETMPEDADYLLLPDENGTFTKETKTGHEVRIENIGKKDMEQVYDELYAQTDGEGLQGGMEAVITYDADEDEIVISSPGGEVRVDAEDIDIEVEGDVDMDSDKWDELVSRAAHSARSQGSEPGGIEGMLEVSKEGDVDYQKYISQKISNMIPSDYTYTRPSNKGRAVGEHLPQTRKTQTLDVIVAVDTSGSVSDELLEQFIAEIQSICKTFEQVDLTVIQHDAKVQKVDEHKNARSSEFDVVDVKGRGGTNHIPVFEEIQENHLQGGPLFTICLTDGYTTVPDEIPFPEGNLLWVLNNYDVDLDRLKHGQIVRIDDADKM